MFTIIMDILNHIIPMNSIATIIDVPPQKAKRIRFGFSAIKRADFSLL